MQDAKGLISYEYINNGGVFLQADVKGAWPPVGGGWSYMRDQELSDMKRSHVCLCPFLNKTKPFVLHI